MREQQIQDAFERWLHDRQIPFIRSRMDKRSTIAKGWPDFSIFWCGRVVFVECKTATGKLSKEQVQVIAELQKNGCRVEIARSVEECCEAARCILTENGRATDASASFPDVIRERFAETKAAVAAVVPGDGTKSKLFLGKIGEAQYVFEGAGTPGTEARMVRKATAADVAQLG